MAVTNSKAAMIAFCIGLMLAGCKKNSAQAVTPAPSAKPAPAIKPAPPTPIAEKKEELGDPSWNPDWDKIVEEALPPEMLGPKAARDVRAYCPRFSRMSEADKRAFWAYFFQALAGAEAGLKPTTSIRHTQPAVAKLDPVTRRTVRSQGLLQLAYMDADRYGCDFNWDKDKELPLKDPARTILQPRNNLECGVKILDNQLFTLNRPLLSHYSYWSTLQPGTVSFHVFSKQMTNVPAACRAHPERRVARDADVAQRR
ncbi:MAG TPA: hypothetical protein VE178_01835 [Silvibacterium sp.]|nr:hypothetical protein [Silvibacterium sp.]